MAKQVNIAILGLGTVGGGVEKILRENKEIIAGRLSADSEEQVNIHLKWIYGKEAPESEALKQIFTKDYDDVLKDESVDIVIETMGGIEPATGFIKSALRAGKHVISANKAAIATAQGELERIAKENHVKFMYEAAVGGTIPVLQGLKNGLVANKIMAIRGIVNGTTNYILTAMYEEGKDFNEVLKVAQELGFAEADPSSDVDGYDAMYKLAILCYLAYGKYPKLEDIKRSSLRDISMAQVEVAKAEGFKYKYIASARLLENGELDLSVSFQKLEANDELFHINGVLNAIAIECDRAGKVVFSGAGAGSEPTASAVISDLVSIIRQI